ncbi:hypothetical protein M404DRAFT_17347 [Pisolithus tinctorius Marx 270]|uniref:PX domain-containing protein n=1 Tax=Pisolithus tinctorius Marx 270 TaxID=870435 RepID=A0A0C3NBU1_PISTI|nr:hypothetical protein M404DRAFT_17347 [Pisolithus tinctorius Marx 270]
MSSSSRPARPTRPVPATPETQQDVVQEDGPTTLTPIRAHYLKKSLIQLQLHKELDDITNAPADNASTLAYLGPPFSPPQKSAQKLDLPFLRYIFRHFVLTFPFMAAAPKDFYSDKLQPFVASVFARNLSPTILIEDADDDETIEATRLKILAKVERNLAMLFSSGTKLVEPEQVVRLSQSDLDRIESLMKNRRKKRRDVFDVNIVCIRTVTDKGRVRSRVHEEFIIRTRLSKDREVCVSRRYGDFKTLADELCKAYQDELVPPPPAKDRTAVDVSSPTLAQSPSQSAFNLSQDSLSQPSHIPGAHYSNSRQYGPFQSQRPERLSREKNRLTLRGYLHTLLANPTFASSPVLRSFLLSGPTRLTPAEQEDARRREDADYVRDEGRRRFAHEISVRIDGLRDSVRSVKGEIIGKDGLMQVFAIIKVTPSIEQLPKNYQAVIEWARISLASTLFQTYVASDNSSETFASLKRTHGLMPYFVLKAALKISNPVGMIRTVLDIFLAQPFGGRSLLQRLFTSSLSEEVKSLSTYIQHVSEKVGDPVLCNKVRAFVYAPREVQDFYRASAVTDNVHLLRAIMHGREEPVLSRVQLARIEQAGRKWEAWERERKKRGEDSDDEGPSDEEVWLFEDLKTLVRLYSRLRDREQLIALIFEGVTADLLKDIITIFYAPLAQVYRAASIADSLGDLQNFINDLIRTVEQTEDLSQTDPTQTVQAFVDLVNRHEQAFYTFVHNVHSKGAGLFDGLMRWIERFLTIARDGVGSGTEIEGAARKISLETLLPAGDEERAAILEEVDRVARYHYALKVVHEERVRRQFWRSQAGGERGSGDDADAATAKEAEAFVHSVAREIGIGEFTRGNENEFFVEADGEDDGEDDEEDEDDESEDVTDDEDSSDFGTDSEEDEEASEELLPSKQSFPEPIAPTKALAHPGCSRPVNFSPMHARKNTQPFVSHAPSPQEVRQRTFSLRNARSMSFVRDKDRGSRSSKESGALPPVPPLPPQFDKPLPPRPSGPLAPSSPSPPIPRRRSSSQLSVNGRTSSVRQATLASRMHGQSGSNSPAPQKAKKNAPGGLQPPELKHIPLLLPVFVEMVRSLTRHSQDSL